MNTKDSEVSNTISLWEQRLTQAEADNDTLRQNVAELEPLRDQLAAQEADAETVIGAWEERLAASEADLQQRIGEVDSLEQQLAAQAEDAANVIAAWEERLNASETENQDLQRRLEEASAQQGELHALRETLSQDEVVVHQWEARANELSETVATLEQQVESLQADLKEQEKDASEAITLWQENCAELETKCTDSDTELTYANETIASKDWNIEQLKSMNESIRLEMEKLKSSLRVNPTMAEELIDATSEISRLTEELETERQKRVDEREKLQAELADERGRHAEARDEVESLTASLLEAEDIAGQWTSKYAYYRESLVCEMFPCPSNFKRIFVSVRSTCRPLRRAKPGAGKRHESATKSGN